MHCKKKNDNEFAWKIQLCYEDKIYSREVCHNTILDDVESSDESLTKVVAKIMHKTRGTPKDMPCSFTPQERYKPMMLEYQSGCHIIYPSNCNSINCDFKIIHNEREVKHITRKNGVEFDYVPNSLRRDKYSQNMQFNSQKEMRVKHIDNLTQLMTHFENHKKSIIHGIGCASELLPTHFKTQYVGECRPITFIVDGTLKKDELVSLIVRTSLDDLHSPRIISWSSIYSAVTTYQTHHPMNQWSMYAVY